MKPLVIFVMLITSSLVVFGLGNTFNFTTSTGDILLNTSILDGTNLHCNDITGAASDLCTITSGGGGNYTNGTGLSLITDVFSILLEYQLPQSCNDGEIAEFNTTSGGWDCAIDNSAASGMASWVLASADIGGSESITDGETVTFDRSTNYLFVNRTTNTITYLFNETYLNTTIDDRTSVAFTDIDTDYGNENVSSVWTFTDGVDHEWNPATYDLILGNTYEGQLKLGESHIGVANDTIGGTVLDSMFIFQNTASSLPENISFLFAGPGGVPRFVLASEGNDLATYNPRSMVIGPAATYANVDENIFCSTNFNHIDCQTGATGADLGVQDDVEVGGTIYAGNWTNVTLTENQIIDLSHTTDTNCNSSGSCSGGDVAYMNIANTGNFDVSGNLTIGEWIASTLGLTLTDDGSDVTLTADVTGSNSLFIATAGAFLELVANPGPSNDDLMFSIEESQGATTAFNFYEGGTGNNGFWSSRSVRIGGEANSLCSSLTSSVDCDTSSTGADLVVQDDIWVGGVIFGNSTATWSNITITESQISDLTHTTDTNANSICTGTTTYLDGEGNCDDIATVYEVQLNNEAGLYSVLSDVSEFIETNDAATLTTLNTGQGANELYAMDQDTLTTSEVVFANVNSTGNISVHQDNVIRIGQGCMFHNGSALITEETCSI